MMFYLGRRFPVPESLGELLRVRREVRENNSILLGRVQRLDYATDQIHLTTIYKVNIYLIIYLQGECLDCKS